MQLAMVGAGYTGGEADQLRRDMAAWKKTGRLLRHRDRLLAGFQARGVSREFAERLFAQIQGFGEYGFPESHAASFALLVYVSGWLKAHFPEHFVCALLNSQPMGFYTPSSLLRDAQAHGVEVRDVCVQASDWDCTLEPVDAGRAPAHSGEATRRRWALRLGLRLVKGLGRGAADRVVAARSVLPFSSLEELRRRAGLRQDELTALAEAGALEALEAGRRQALWKARAPRLPGLFAGHDAPEPSVRLPPLRAPEQLLLDYARKELSVGDHPLRHLRARLRSMNVVPMARLAELPDHARVRVAGLVLSRQQPVTASGIVFVTLEDETGVAHLVLWRRVFEAHRLAARHARILLAEGRLERQITPPRDDEPELCRRAPPVAVLHLVVERLERLDRPGALATRSRDFH